MAAVWNAMEGKLIPECDKFKEMSKFIIMMNLVLQLY